MKFLYLAYFMGLPVLLGAALVFPVALIFHRGIACAGEDEHRVTPDGSWLFFGRGVRRARGAWLWLGGALWLLAFFGGRRYWPMHSDHQSWLITLLFAAWPLAIGLTVAATSCLVGFLIAPRFRRLISLAAVMGLATAILLWLGHRGLMSFLPGEWLTVRHRYQTLGPNNLMIPALVAAPLYPFVHLAISCVLTVAAWGWAKRQGEHWFRFEG